jgi:hypothetical protein
VRQISRQFPASIRQKTLDAPAPQPFGGFFVVQLEGLKTGVHLMLRPLLALGMIVCVSAPAFSAEYYVVRGPDKRCRVVETKPADTTVVQVGPMAFVTRDEAESQVRVLCKEESSTHIEVEKVR